MDKLPKYNPDIPERFYDSLGEKEWTRLSKNRLGELLFHVHMDIFRQYAKKDTSVLELGAGAGVFSKEFVRFGTQLVVSDISEKQLTINRSKMAELRLEEQIEAFQLLDITDLSSIDKNHYDMVTCVGGALNYTFDKEQAAVSEMLRVTKPGGIVIVGVMSFISALVRYLPAVVEEKQQFGIAATNWVMDTGIQDAEHYPVKSRHYVHMMESKDLDLLFEDQNVQILEKRAAGILAMAGETALNQAKEDDELWPSILHKEIKLSKNPACLDCGANIIYVVRKK